MILALVLALVPGDRVVLKDRASVEGRYVRLLDLVQSESLPESARRALAPVWLGRAPEPGATRTVTADDIRRELERRGLDPDAFELHGLRVEVSFGARPEEDSLRLAVAFEIKRHLLETHAGLRADEIAVRLSPAGLPAEAEVIEVTARAEDVPGSARFSARLRTAAGERVVSGDARILRAREVLVAARDIAPGKTLESADVELRRVELSGDETVLTDAAPAVGSSSLVRIGKGALLGPRDLRLKPVLRRGEVVRAVARDFEVDARALEDGAPGAEIALEFVSTKNRFRGRVAGAGQVRVTENDR